MKKLERFKLIDRVGRELQARMSYSDIDVFLQSFGIITSKKKTSGANSKWIYVKELLADERDDLILQIADELEIPHGYTIATNFVQEESRFWKPGYFRLFLSHLSKDKIRAAQLKDVLKKYAISCFVAHEDIEPTLEWQTEIEKALFSMDALVALLSPNFNESKWTDQEIGFALGRGTLVIPLRKGLDPYGFIGKVQGIQAEGKTVGQVASLIFYAISSNAATKNKIATALADQVIAAPSVDLAIQFLNSLRSIDGLPLSHLERLQDNLPSNHKLVTNSSFVKELNIILTERDLPKFVHAKSKDDFDDDIPF